MERIHSTSSLKPRAVASELIASQITLPSADWHLYSYRDANQYRSCWVSPTRKIKFKLLKDAIEFERLRKLFDEDETLAWKMYSKSCTEKGQCRRVIADNHLESCGWLKCVKQTLPNQRYVWLTPDYKIPFLWKKIAEEFEEFCQQHEEERIAINLFIQTYKPVKKISDFILGGEPLVNRHLSGEVDTNNIFAVTELLKIHLVPTNHRMITTTGGAVHSVPTCCNCDGTYITKKKRTTKIFDYEVVVKINDTTTPKTKKRKKEYMKGKEVEKKEHAKDEWEWYKSCIKDKMGFK